MNPFYLGAALVVLSAAGFAFIPIFALYAYEGGATVTTLLLLRFTMASLCFFGYIFYKEGRVAVDRSSIKYLLLLGGVLYTLQSNLYFSSVKFIPASLAVLIFYIYPVFVALASSFIDKEPLTKQIVGSLVLALGGLTLVLGNSFQDINLPGVLLALGAGVAYTCYIVLGNRVLKSAPPLVTSAFICLFAAIALLIIGLGTDTLHFALAPQAWFSAVGVALCCTVLAIFTFFRGIELIGSTRASIISVVEPLITVLFSMLLFQEKLTLLQAFGGVAVLVGALLAMAQGPQKNQQSQGKQETC